ncbi:MAG: hypothetical protein CM15mP109_10460 [Candidatus Dadabacteria bacterium]|nr:MAG: hypothetical protein CM15mP109_10460 [Candidatus Dadabacteria bacterium]
MFSPLARISSSEEGGVLEADPELPIEDWPMDMLMAGFGQYFQMYQLPHLEVEVVQSCYPSLCLEKHQKIHTQRNII